MPWSVEGLPQLLARWSRQGDQSIRIRMRCSTCFKDVRFTWKLHAQARKSWQDSTITFNLGRLCVACLIAANNEVYRELYPIATMGWKPKCPSCQTEMHEIWCATKVYTMYLGWDNIGEAYLCPSCTEAAIYMIQDACFPVHCSAQVPSEILKRL